jgi:hypothetical protein
MNLRDCRYQMTHTRQCFKNLRCIIICAVWCRRTDELVDGPNASHITPQALDRWERRLEDLFVGRPYDMLDAALSDTITKFPIDIQVRATSWCICHSSALHVSVSI